MVVARARARCHYGLRMAADAAATRACPWCGESILAVAKKCKHCGEFLTDELPQSSAVTTAADAAHASQAPSEFACEACKFRTPSNRALYLHRANEHGLSGTRASGAPLSANERSRLREVGPSLVTAPDFRGSVWTYTGFRWKCLAHGKGVCRECSRKMKLPRKAGKAGERVPAPGLHLIVCPHCQTPGKVTTKVVQQKKGISGGKATAAVFTAGISMLGIGLSRKEEVTEAHCGRCGSTWHY